MKTGLLLLFLLLFFAAGGQTLSYQTLSIDNGLPTNDIYYTMQDAQGYVWFGTRNGVQGAYRLQLTEAGATAVITIPI